MKKIVIISIVLGSLIFNKVYLSDNKLDSEISNEVNVVVENIDINNFEKIKIGDTKQKLFSLIGEPSRIDESEYDFKWYVYNQYKEKFVMVGIDNEEVVALYSNYLNSSEIENIHINDDKSEVLKKYKPLEYKKKGNIRYVIDSKGQYDVVKLDNKYITFFYDIYEKNRICSYQIISNESENKLHEMYASSSNELMKSFELQIIDLTNSVRYQRNLNELKYSQKATLSSRKHSDDMMKKDYFDHINKENKNPFDRMKKEGIVYVRAGENIAAGQTSAIYAHEAWMNSEGHRKNILGEYNNIGVGVIFGGTYTIYYTQNFYK